jgi:para-nitrobenzyl esterase
MTRRYVVVLAAVLSVNVVVGGAADVDPVRIDTGMISGVSGRHTGVRAFKGIPFAAPPVGTLRWRSPQPREPWAGVRSGERFGPRCMQPTPEIGVAQDPRGAAQPMGEDCLYLNVWTAAKAAADGQPVIVWAHGGSFTVGAGSLPEHDGENLARKGAVVVTVNYRLGPFGFFAHPELTHESATGAGNYGFMDLVAALEWVQRNIAAFGGDKNRVTLMGQSAGGYLAQYAMASPRLPKLFNRAVIQSAPVRVVPVATLAAAERVGQTAASALNASSLARLRALSAEDVLKGLPPSRPIVDGHLITADQWTSARAGTLKQVNLLVGSNADEGTFPYLRARELGLGSMSTAEFMAYVRERFGPDAERILALYPARGEAATRASQLAAFADEAAWNAQFFARAAAMTGAKAYLYSFVHDPPVATGTVDRGATHTAEIPYVFNNPQPLWTEVDRRLAEQMSSYWVNFASSGDPNGRGRPAWPAIVPGEGERLMRIGARADAAPSLDPGRVRLFESLLHRLVPFAQQEVR